MATEVVNKYKEKYDIYIGRGSLWGNPFVIGEHGTREEVIAQYKDYFYSKIEASTKFKEETLKLKDSKLGCFCAPKPCHGDIIKEWLDKNS